MDRVLQIRRPAEQSQVALSRASKIFFGCDIFQVIAVVVFQGSMIALGDFSAYNNVEHPGMGPGRRIYMIIYMGAVVYTCFLCLFAVKRQNFMEIIAFDLQNFAFVTYSFIQLYHVKFKKYNGLRISENDALPKIVIANATTLLFLNVVFTYLSYKLYMEFGWKIYKRVRFNIRLRGIYQIYELLSCLLKMEILYWGMYAIVHSLVLLRDTHNILFFVSLAFIPLSFIYAGLGYYATHRENRLLMVLFLSWTVAGIGYFLYKLYGFITRKCSGCVEFEKTGKDIPAEAFMHFVYLGIMNLVVAMTIFGVALKAYLNFGGGLAEHFNRKKPQSKFSVRYDLGLERGSHSYPEESVVSVTSYEFDEFGESVRLDRGMLHPGIVAPPLLTESGQNLIDKRSCSLPNLLAESPTRPCTFPGPSDGNMSLLSGWLQAQEGKQNSVPREITSVFEEKPAENPERNTYDFGGKQKCDVIYLQGCEDTEGSKSASVTNGVQSSGNVDGVSPNFHSNGYVKQRAEVHMYKDTTLAPEHKQNGHFLGKTCLKCKQTHVENCQCEVQAVTGTVTKCSCDDEDEEFSRDVNTGKPLLKDDQLCYRTARLKRSSSSDDEVFSSLT